MSAALAAAASHGELKRGLSECAAWAKADPAFAASFAASDWPRALAMRY